MITILAAGTRHSLKSRGSARLAVVALAMVVGVVLAARSRWLCDDIFITFRYADNIVAGHGVVYNIGERVEGFTHFLWLAMIVAWKWMGGAPETIVIALGLIAFAGVIVACGLRSTVFPLAAILLALHYDFHIWATSGLETMAFTLAVLLAVFAQIDRRYLWAGVALSVAVLLRPDALVFCAVALAWAGFDKGRGRAFIALPFLAYAVYVAWRLSYYRDLFPNPYYSKSAGDSYWDQGWFYIWSYFKNYWSSFLCLLALPFIRRREVAIPLSFAAAYLVLFVARVGGDFMFARFMIPIVPLLYVPVETVLEGRPASHRRARAAAQPQGRPTSHGRARARAAAQPPGGAPREMRVATRRHATRALLVTVAAVPLLITDNMRHDDGLSKEGQRHTALVSRGIMDEHWYYTRDAGGMTPIGRDRELGRVLKKYFQNEQVTVLLRGQAALAYYAGFSVAIESSGLTDRAIARTTIPKRGRPGHEKGATLDYLKQRRVDFVFMRQPYNSTSREILFRVGESQVRAEIISESGLAERLMKRFPNDITMLN